MGTRCCETADRIGRARRSGLWRISPLSCVSFLLLCSLGNYWQETHSLSRDVHFTVVCAGAAAVNSQLVLCVTNSLFDLVEKLKRNGSSNCEGASEKPDHWRVIFWLCGWGVVAGFPRL